MRFVSCEPQLKDIDFRHYLQPHQTRCPYPVNWIINGGESKQGRKHRPRAFHLDWPLRIIEDCRAFDVPVFIKQLGSNPSGNDGWQKEACRAIRHAKGERPSEWPACLRVQEFPPESEVIPPVITPTGQASKPSRPPRSRRGRASGNSSRRTRS